MDMNNRLLFENARQIVESFINIINITKDNKKEEWQNAVVETCNNEIILGRAKIEEQIVHVDTPLYQYAIPIQRLNEILFIDVFDYECLKNIDWAKITDIQDIKTILHQRHKL